MVTIKDNYLSENEFKKVRDIFFNSQLEWKLKHGVAYEPNGSLDDYFFGHLVYQYVPMSPHFADIMNIFHPRFLNHVITRIKCNLYTRTPKLVKHDWHTDHDTLPVLKGGLLMLNTCDGYTGFEDGTKVESVENRMVFFDALKKHHSTNTTNVSTRITLNINYL
tara:strand:- start:53 stop:544 length:492 start_codon:yes stop_codon:yes gene_type:complete